MNLNSILLVDLVSYRDNVDYHNLKMYQEKMGWICRLLCHVMVALTTLELEWDYFDRAFWGHRDRDKSNQS
jgi:hypothetical protein